MAASGGAVRLPQRLPWPVAMELLLLGEPVDAQRALELQLVNRVVPGDEVVSAAVELAERLTANGPLAVQASKRVARTSLADGEAAGWQLNAELAPTVTGSEDAAEAGRAASEKREPAWSGPMSATAAEAGPVRPAELPAGERRRARRRARRPRRGRGAELRRAPARGAVARRRPARARRRARRRRRRLAAERVALRGAGDRRARHRRHVAAAPDQPRPARDRGRDRALRRLAGDRRDEPTTWTPTATPTTARSPSPTRTASCRSR